MMKSTVTYILIAWITSAVNAQIVDTRSVDGSFNNPIFSNSGAANIHLKRLGPPNYLDGMSSVVDNQPNARKISNTLFSQSEPIHDEFRSDLFWNFGQFIDHDVVLNRGNSGEVILVDVPIGDSYFDPDGQGQSKIPIVRGAYDNNTGVSVPREQINQITAWLDGSLIYGSDEATTSWLRTGLDGKLKQSSNNLLPFNTIDGEYESEIDYSAPFMENPIVPQQSKIFVAGDIRANEQPGLLSLHTLFVREHNRICDRIKSDHPEWNDEALFQVARKYVGAVIQSITYNEWLPVLGVKLEPYGGYDDSIEVSIYNEFSAMAFRFGHSLVNEQFIRIDEVGQETVYGSVSLHEAFFNPLFIKDEGGIEPFLRGMATQLQQKFDPKIIGSMRNFLFGKPGDGGLDLSVINIMRGRERGIADYNTLRESIGLEKYESFSQLTDDSELVVKLEELYGSIDKLDPWVGILSEKALFNDTFLGETAYEIIKRQFEELRDGDRFWYQVDPYFTSQDVDSLTRVRLADVIRANTPIQEIQDEVFRAQNPFLTVSVQPFVNVKKFSVKLYPNPFFERLVLEVDMKMEEVGIVRISSLNGQILFSKTILLRPGVNKYELDFSHLNLDFGSYIFELNADGHNGSYTIIKN